MGLKFTNFATSTIANVGGIAAGALSLDVQAGAGALFPVISGSDYFYCVLVDISGNREVVKCTGRSTDTLTIVRAQDGTSARVFDQGDVVELRITKGALEEFTGAVDDIVTHLASDYHFPATTVMIFGQNSAPTGWTRKTDWSDNAMLCYAASGDIDTGGSVNPQSTHTHAGVLHTHTGPLHKHTGPSHIHSTLSHALTEAELPAHRHSYNVGSASLNLLGAGGSSIYTYAPTASNTGYVGSGSAHSHGNTGAGGTEDTGESGTANTSYPVPEGADATGANTAPFFQEVIAATKDAYA